MTDLPTAVANAVTAQTVAAPTAKKPQPLTRGECWLAGLLMLAGAALIAATLVAFSNVDSHFTFKSKEVITREPAQRAGRGRAATGASAKPSAAGSKESKEVEYADTVTIFALTAGAALVLAGAFYGRIRSLKLGGLELGLVGDEQKQAAEEKAAATVATEVTDTNKTEAAKAAAAQVAVADLNRAVAYGVQPTEPVIEQIAQQAAKKVARAIG